MNTNKRGMHAILLFTLFLFMAGKAFSFDLGDVLKEVDINKVIGIGKSTQKAFSDFSEEESYYIGRGVGANLLAKHRLQESGDLQDYISAIGQTLALASDRPDSFRGYHFIVLDEPDRVNAYAVPSGFIFITTGLIGKAETEDELAGVMAHEVAHIVLDHPINSIKKSYRDNLKKQILSFAADQVAQQNEQLSQLVEGLNELSGMIIDSAARGYSREKEDEADAEAVRIMVSAGYDPTALSSVLKKLSPIGSGESGTHGNPASRARNVSNISGKVDNAPQTLDARTARFTGAVSH